MFITVAFSVRWLIWIYQTTFTIGWFLFSGHSHCTRYGGESLALLEISAGIIQGSGIGPASYVVNSSDLAALTPGNFLCKNADDTYIIIPSDNVDSRSEELVNVETWAVGTGQQLNP